MRIPSWLKPRLPWAFLGILAFLMGLWACNIGDSQEKSYLAIKIDSTWMGYDSILVILTDSGSGTKDTIFHHEVKSPEDLDEVPADHYHGGKIVVQIIGFKGGKATRQEFRLYDGATRTTIARDTSPDFSSKKLRVQPKHLKLYTGGETVQLKTVPAASGLSWKPLEDGLVTVTSDGVVTPVAAGSARVMVSSGDGASDTAYIQVVKDAPVIDAGGPDTLVELHASVIFHVGVTQEYGVVKTFSWDLDGDGKWDGSQSDIPAAQTLFAAPARVFDAAGDFIVHFLVRDGEGNETSATLKVKVADKVPRIDSLTHDLAISIGDRVSFAALVSESGGGTLQGFAWDYDGNGSADDTAAISSNPAHVDGTHVFPDTGVFTVSLRVTDAAGLVARGQVQVTVKRDPPTANAGDDTTVQAGATVNLHGSDADGMGSVMKREWKVGDQPYRSVSDGKLSFTAPAEAGPLACLYRVTDDDGQETVDAMTVTVTATTPVPGGKLTGLSLSDGSLAPAFDPAVLEYAASLSNSVSTVTVLPLTAAAAGDTVRVNGKSVVSGNASDPLTLSVGENTITVDVTAKGGSPKSTYHVKVTRAASAAADLSALTVSVGSLSPAFTPSRTAYDDSVGNAVASLSVTATAADAGATITVEGAPVASGNASSSIALPVGLKVVTIEVTSQDKSATRSYKITMKRAAPVLSSNADLSALAPSAGSLSPAFAAGTLNYTVSVANAVGNIKVTPSAADAGATIKVDGADVASGAASADIALPVGSKDIPVVVKAQDGTTKSYKITVTRAGASNADLSALTLSAGSLSPAFSPNTLTYTASVANALGSIKVTPTVADAGASVTVEGGAVASGSPSGNIALPVGSKAITIVVTAQDGTPKTYKVTVTRGASSDANLSALSISAGSLSPAFSAGQLNYSVSVGNGVSTFKVTPTASDAGASVTVEGVAVASGSASQNIALPIGAKTITVEVTAADASVQDYKIAVTRAGSANADLAGLSLSTGSLSPSFSSAQLNYSVSVANGVSSVTVTPTVADGNASVKVENVAVASGSASGAVALPVGSKDITIVVTAQDGTPKTYKVTVTRAGSSNADLSGLSVSAGAISFSSSTTTYNLSVAASVTSTTITPTAAVPGSTLQLNYGSTLQLINTGSTSGPISLNEGLNVIKVFVTAQDNVSSKTYTVNITRAAAATADLSALVPAMGSLSPSFSPSTTGYSVTVTNADAGFSMAPMVASAGATIVVNPGNIPVTSGQNCQFLPLVVGTNVFQVVVTPPGGGATKTYTVNVTRPNPAFRLAYFTNDFPSSNSTPSGSTAYNSAGGAMSITRSSTGVYTVVLNGIGTGAIARGAGHVTALGTSGASCSTGGLADNNGTITAVVYCYSTSGAPVDTRFSFVLLDPHTGPNAYGEFYIGSSATYTPFSFYSSAGGAMPTATRDKMGFYTVHFPGLTGAGGVLVTDLTQSSNHCSALTFANSTSDFEVVCALGSNADYADSRFTFSVFGPVGATEGMGFGYAHVHDNSPNGSSPDPSYSHNSAGGAVTIGHSTTGIYTLTFNGLGSVQSGRGGNFQVSPYAYTSRCTVNGWSGSPNLSAEVRCFDLNGNLMDSDFQIMVTK